LFTKFLMTEFDVSGIEILNSITRNLVVLQKKLIVSKLRGADVK
jgi:hypothetical protein